MGAKWREEGEDGVKKWKRAAALLLAAVTALSLSGCGIFETKLARAIQKMSNLDSLHFSLQLEAALELRAAGQTEDEPRRLPLSGSLEAEGELYTDPLRSKFSAALSLPGSQARQECYLEKEEHAYYLYSRLNDGTLWQKQGLAGQDGTKVKGLRYIVSSMESFQAAGEEPLGGQPAARYDGVLAGENLAELLRLYGVREFLADGVGLQLRENVFEELPDVPASVWVDAGTGMIVRVEADLTALGAAIAERQLEDSRNALGLESVGVELALTGLRLRLALSGFNEAEAFQIPEAAKAAWGDSVMPWEK